MDCWEERPRVRGKIRLALAEVRRSTPLARLRGTPGGQLQSPSSFGPPQALLLLLLLLLLGAVGGGTLAMHCLSA